ncbi:MAG: hypothetical protein HYX48_00845 [Chlamydiales bacterium]|nr:hypothetical protein [Chlamydiales bacterium]
MTVRPVSRAESSAPSQPNLMLEKLPTVLVKRTLGYLSVLDLKAARTCKEFSYLNRMELMKQWEVADLALLVYSMKQTKAPFESRVSRCCELLSSNGGNLRALILNVRLSAESASLLFSKTGELPFLKVRQLTLSTCSKIPLETPLAKLQLTKLVINKCAHGEYSDRYRPRLFRDDSCFTCEAGIVESPLPVFLPGAGALTSLELSHLGTLGPEIEVLPTLSSLTDLTIRYCTIGLVAVKAIGRCIQLRSLRFDRNSATDPYKPTRLRGADVTAHFASLQALENLEIYNAPRICNGIRIEEKLIQLAEQLKRVKTLRVNKERAEAVQKALPHISVQPEELPSYLKPAAPAQKTTKSA